MEVNGYKIEANADLRGANLRYADLRRADLWGADLQGAYLQGADLRCANLRDAILRNADLRNADLRGADLQGADLRDADLQGADLRDADLWGADLQGAKRLCCVATPPEEGAFVCYKKVRGGVVLTLEVPAWAERTGSLVGPKCRASAALVLGSDQDNARDVYHSKHDDSEWRVGELREEPNYDGDPRVECAPGLHFFMSYAKAKAYGS